MWGFNIFVRKGKKVVTTLSMKEWYRRKAKKDMEHASRKANRGK